MLAELHWVLPSRLAGSARPGLLGDLDDDLRELAGVGVRRVVTLTEAALDLGARDLPFTVTHFPIADMGVPTPRAALGVCLDVVDDIGQGRAVLFHCKAGLGRTGTMLAASLVLLGHGAPEAIAAVRATCRNYVQTASQAAFLRHFEQFARSAAPSAATTVREGTGPWR